MAYMKYIDAPPEICLLQRKKRRSKLCYGYNINVVSCTTTFKFTLVERARRHRASNTHKSIKYKSVNKIK